MTGMTKLTATDGHEFDCWMQNAEGEARGAIVILQEIFGVTDQLKGVAARYAKLGYNVAIPALFDRRQRGTVVPFDQGPVGRDLMLSLPADEVMLDVAATVSKLGKGGLNVGVIGFCWGGGLAVRAAQTQDIAAAVAFYGTKLNLYQDDDLKAPVLMHLGTTDDHVPPEMRDAFTARFPEVEVHMYEAGHAFANDARTSHVPDAAETAHDRTAAFLAKHL